MTRFLKTNTKRAWALLVGLSVFSLYAPAQSFTLKQCIDYANQHNKNILNAGFDTEIAQQQVNEQVGTMLPQIEGTGTYTNNLQLPTTVLPGEIIGQPGTDLSLQMGTQHNVNAGVQLTQKIYDPTFGNALKASKLSKLQAETSRKMTTEDIQYTISSVYYQTLVIQKQIASQEESLKSLKYTLESTELQYENGTAMKLDVDRIRVSYHNAQSQLRQANLNFDQSVNNLKYYMGMPIDTMLSIEDSNLDLEHPIVETPNRDISFQNRKDYQIQQISLQANELDKKRHQSGYLPSLSFNAYYGTMSLSNEFDFFSDADWNTTSYIGLNLRVPIFDGLQKRARISQSRLQIEKSKFSMDQLEESIKLEVSNSDMQYQNALDNIQNEKANLELAESIYRSTQLQYQQGASSTLDLVQAETSYRESQNNYYRELLNLYIARIDLEKSKGTLNEYITNLK